MDSLTLPFFGSPTAPSSTPPASSPSPVVSAAAAAHSVATDTIAEEAVRLDSLSTPQPATSSSAAAVPLSRPSFLDRFTGLMHRIHEEFRGPDELEDSDIEDLPPGSSSPRRGALVHAGESLLVPAAVERYPIGEGALSASASRPSTGGFLTAAGSQVVRQLRAVDWPLYVGGTLGFVALGLSSPPIAIGLVAAGIATRSTAAANTLQTVRTVVAGRAQTLVATISQPPVPVGPTSAAVLRVASRRTLLLAPPPTPPSSSHAAIPTLLPAAAAAESRPPVAAEARTLPAAAAESRPPVAAVAAESLLPAAAVAESRPPVAAEARTLPAAAVAESPSPAAAAASPPAVATLARRRGGPRSSLPPATARTQFGSERSTATRHFTPCLPPYRPSIDTYVPPAVVQERAQSTFMKILEAHFQVNAEDGWGTVARKVIAWLAVFASAGLLLFGILAGSYAYDFWQRRRAEQMYV